ncbi:MAG TPA: Minf_1886 family protein [Gemmataceae bacterium]|jgi:uncharacterized repeat protein (TIGR04138 family)
MHHPKLDEVVRKDPRYAVEAYDFVHDALRHTLRKLGKEPPAIADQISEGDHVTVPQLLEGVRDLALREFGLMARTVFRSWGINSTADVGEIVFNLVAADLMKKTNEDSRDDFRDVFDLDQVLMHDYHIDVKEQIEEDL